MMTGTFAMPFVIGCLIFLFVDDILSPQFRISSEGRSFAMITRAL